MILLIRNVSVLYHDQLPFRNIFERRSMIFALKSFPETDQYTISYEIEKGDTGSVIRVTIRGDYSSIDFSGAVSDELWRGTCVELFIRNPEEEAYTEINCAPDGRCQTMAFSEYRASVSREIITSQMALSLEKSDQSAQVLIQLSGVEIEGKEIGVAVITADNQGNRLFWGIDHWGGSPDFHRWENFVVWHH